MSALNTIANPAMFGSRAVADAYCTTVRRLYWQDNDNTATPDTIKRVLLSMNAHTDSEDVQSKGVRAMRGIACQNSDSLRNLLALGALDALYTAADLYPTCKHLQGYVCYIFHIISHFSSEAADALRAGPASEIAKRLQRSHAAPSIMTHFADLVLETLAL